MKKHAFSVLPAVFAAIGCLGSACNTEESNPLWPRLNANIFSPIREDPEAYAALAAFDNVFVGQIYSTARDGGYDYGTKRGYGSFASVEYDFSGDRNGGQEVIHRTKGINPAIQFVAHLSLQKLELDAFGYGTTTPLRWFSDSISPRWFAYTPLIPLQAGERDERAVSFRFDPADLRKFVAYGARGTEGVWPGGDKYGWTYLCFYDNDAGAGRGSFEVMAIQSIVPESGVITVARDRAGSRTCYGRPQRYSKGHRMGILSHSAESFGSPAMAMNPTARCERVPADPGDPSSPRIDWMEACREYVRTIVLPAGKPPSGPGRVFLAGGTIMDADDEDVRKTYGFTMFRHDNWHVDLDRDGVVDGDLDADGDLDDPAIPTRSMVEGYEAYEDGLRSDASAFGRPEFLVLKNGVVTELPRELNGRRYEDLNEFFQDENLEDAINQYLAMGVPGNLAAPVLVAINERDRRNLLKEDTFAAHRAVMALTYVFGDGYYGHTGEHALRHRTIIGNEEPDGTDDWMDEFSVNPDGVGCNHPAYGAFPRERYSDWMGAALGPGREIDAAARTYRRDFENAVVLYSIQENEVSLGGTFRKILGGDDPVFNDGSEATSTRLPARGGAILMRPR